MSEPCPRCGVRADIGCKHRPAEGYAPLAITSSEKAAKRPGNFNSPWGKAGNPTGKDADRIRASLRSLFNQ